MMFALNNFEKEAAPDWCRVNLEILAPFVTIIKNVARLQKGDRVGFKTLEDDRKVRYFKSNGEVVDI